MKTHLGVSGILKDRDGKILLGLRSQYYMSCPGMWCTPGGGVDCERESVDRALEREFLEECGLYVQVGRLIATIELVSTQHSVLLFKEILTYWSGDVKASDEFDKVDWFSPRQLRNRFVKRLVTPATQAALTIYFGA